MLKQIFGKIWLVWSILIFILSWLPAALAYFVAYRLLPASKKYKNGFAVSKVWGRLINLFVGVRLREYGKEDIDFSQQYVMVCNHRSQIDIPINFVSSPVQFVILAKQSAAKIPVIGINLRNAHVLVNRKDKEDRKRSLNTLRKHLKAGQTLLIYPEGRRLRGEDQLGPFHDGAFLLAKEAGVPILPITIVGSDRINNPKRPLEVFPGRVDVYYDAPISTEGSLSETKAEVRAVLAGHLS
ncbi:MAG: 1-acyl-sn-glycerol-3-phosphate acyltransferase [Saprospiraceae bacterium]|nr:1-acyl-sn-glycerol-3-phosphate acyltransferase [Saprospiraceae bacterium]